MTNTLHHDWAPKNPAEARELLAETEAAMRARVEAGAMLPARLADNAGPPILMVLTED